MQLLTVAIPPLERMAKEGEEGRKKIGAITRYVAVVLGLVQGFGTTICTCRAAAMRVTLVT